ncbi:MAG: serine hydrolase domain-containing protein [Armatimonadota bacterium]
MSHSFTSFSRRRLLQGFALGSAACILGDLSAGPAGAAVGGSGKLRRGNPAELGVDPRAVGAFIDAVEQKVGGLHSFMLLRGGQVAAEAWWTPYAPAHPHMLYSLSKSFTSTGIGLAVAEGRLSVEDRVTSFFPDDLPSSIDQNLRKMQVRHLLSMSTGHERDATGPTAAAKDGNWVRAFLALPVEREPGTHFVYNSAATYMLSAIIQKLTGQTLLDYLTPRLLAPLGIRNATWESDPRGINTGGWGLSIKTEEIARFGQLYLQRGKWGDRQLVPESWVAEASGKQIANGSNPNSDWNQGYGYQFWRCRHGAYRGDGAFGQYCVVMPEQEAVLAITSGIGDMQAVLNAAWEHLLPGMQLASGSSDAAAELEKKLKSRAVSAPQGKASSPTAERVSGRVYRFETNDDQIRSGALTFGKGRASLTLWDERGQRELPVGSDEWLRGTAPLGGNPIIGSAGSMEKVATRGAWVDDDTYAIKTCYVETPYVETTTWKFDGDRVTVTRKMNVGFGSTDRPALTGRIA